MTDEVYLLDEWKPWLLQPHSQVILDRSLAVYRNLFRAIEQRMPDVPLNTTPPSSTSEPDDEHLTEIEPEIEIEPENKLGPAVSTFISTNQVSKISFVGKFLQLAACPKKPSLEFIAPGLHIPTPESLLNQPFQDIDFHTSGTCNPILLFPADQEQHTIFEETVHNRFGYPYSGEASYRSGLWISKSSLDGPDFDDCCRLLLPQHVVELAAEQTEHHAKSTEGLILEHYDGEGLSAGLYQASCNPFIPRHEVELFRVLEH